MVILGLQARTRQASEPDVVIGISAAQFQRTDMLIDEFTGLKAGAAHHAQPFFPLPDAQLPPGR